jgi:phosphate transport system permease protein
MEVSNQQNQTLALKQSVRFTISGKEKNMLAAFFLSLIFGPLGLFYSTTVGGIVMTVIGGLVVFASKLTDSPVFLKWGLIFVWVISMIWSYNTAKKTIKNAERRLMFRNAESLLYKGIIFLLAFMITIPLIVVLVYIIKQGVTQVNWHFLTHVPAPVGETGGGILNALVGSFIMVMAAAVIAIPVGMMAGIYLSENSKTRLAYYSGMCVDILQGVPSIVVGIVIYFWIVKPAGTFSAISGSVALAIMMLPIVIRSTEQTLKMLPDSLKEAGLALGVPYHRVMLKIIVPCGFSGILSGIMLSIARVVGETAPLIFTAFGNPYLSGSITKPMESLPHLIYTYATSPYDDWHNLAWGASFILLVFVLSLNIITKVITRKWKVQL